MIYANITDVEKRKLEEEENKSWTSYISKGIIILKFIVVSTLLIQVFLSWFKSKEKMKPQALGVRKLVLFQCFTAFILLVGATIFEFAFHYTHFYLVLFVIATFLFYATLFIVLKLGAVDLPDVAILQ